MASLLKEERRFTSTHFFSTMRDSGAAFLTLWVLLRASIIEPCTAWLVPSPSSHLLRTRRSSSIGIYQQHRRIPPSFLLFAEKPKSSTDTTTTTSSTVLEPRTDEVVDEDAPAGIGGAEFFGGNKEKQEFYDPVAEAEAAVELRSTSVVLEFDRFADRSAFADETTAAIARDVQLQLNQLAATAPELVETTSSTSLEDVTYKYADNLQWETDLQVKSSTPVLELVQARDFYRQVHVAVTAGGPQSDSTVELRWELSLEWPTVWEPRVLLTGTSRLTVDSETKIITRQIDTLDDPDLIPVIQRQILPRFWDLYHIGMTPSAELSPRLKSDATSTSKVGLLASYQLYDLPPRWVLQPSLLDTGSREDNNALVLPNHAFSCVIKTMGPTKQRFTPVSGVQVQLVSQQQSQQLNGNAAGAGGGLKLQWNIPLAVEYGSQAVWMLPGGDDATEDQEENGESNSSSHSPQHAQTECRYVFQGRRRVATIAYGGNPQDEDIAAVRQKLYEHVVTRDGHPPKVDGNGRPVFFYTQNAVKACYTEEGLGMAVYEWRPRFTQPNEVGIELEL